MICKLFNKILIKNDRLSHYYRRRKRREKALPTTYQCINNNIVVIFEFKLYFISKIAKLFKVMSKLSCILTLNNKDLQETFYYLIPRNKSTNVNHLQSNYVILLLWIFHSLFIQFKYNKINDVIIFSLEEMIPKKWLTSDEKHPNF